MPDDFDQLPLEGTGGDDFDQLPQAAVAADDFDQLPTGNGENAQLNPSPALSLTQRLRRGLSPLLGPTDSQKLEDGVTMTDANGNQTRVYKPFGSAVDAQGFFPALSKPTIAIPKATHSADDHLIAAAAKAVYNTGAGFAEFMESPLGVATAGMGSLPMMAKGAVPITEAAINAVKLTGGAQRAVAAGYAGDMALKTPELATQAGTTSVTGTTGQKIEADLGLGVNTALAGTLAGEATGLPSAMADKLGATPAVWRPQDLRDGSLPLTDAKASEFGGAALQPVDDFDALPEADAVQTSAFETGGWAGGSGRDEFDALPAASAVAPADVEAEAAEAGTTSGDGGDTPPLQAEAPEEQLSFEDRLGNWADQTIAGAQGRLNVGVDPTVLAAYAVKGALLIKQGIVDFGRWSAEMVREHGEAVRPYLSSLFQQSGGLAQGEGLREFGKKLQVNPEISPEAKEAVGEYTYTIGNNADAAAAAKQILAAHGLDAAARLFSNPRASIDPDLRVILGGELIDQLGRDYRVALSKGDSAGADALLSKQVDVADERLRQGTDLAKGLQANKVYDALSTAGILKQADGMFGDAGQNELNRLAPVTDQVREGFRAANDAAVAGTIRDAKVNDAARAAVNDAVEGSAATRKGVIVEVTGAFAESPEIVRQARDQLRGQLDRILQTQGVPRAARSGEQLRAILDDTAKRAAGIAAGHFQGAELGKTLAEKYRERLNLSPYEAQRLAKVMEREYGRMVDAARAKIPARIAAARARQAAPFDPNEFNQTALDKEIARQLKDQNLRLGDLVKQHSTVVDATGRSIGERVVKGAGLTGPRADALQGAFDKRFAELATAAKQRALKQLTDAGVKLPKPLRGDRAQELIKLTNLGAFTDEKFNGELSKRLDLPVLTPELKREIAARANALQEIPKGDLRNRAATQLLDYISQQRGLKPWELPAAVWYANVLNPITTPVHILFDNIPNLVFNTLTDAFLNPRAITGMPGAFGRGLKRGTLDAAEILKTGIATGINDRIVGSHTLELDPFKGALAPLNNLKYVGRILSAAHVATFRPAYELKSLLVARDAARNEGLTGTALDQRVADILGNTEARVNAARAQAAAEGSKGMDFRRRTAEIIEQQRDTAVPGIHDEALKYARQVTYLNKPYGLIGAAGNGLDLFEQQAGKVSPVAALMAKTLIPFKNIVGNLTNEKLNYFGPTAAVRVYWGNKNGTLYGDKISPGEPQRIVVKAVMGTAILSAVSAAVASGKLVITGNGPRSLDQKKQLFAADGWKPNSIKVGNTYYSYMRTPMATAFSVLGNYLDAAKYNGLDKKDLLARTTFAAWCVPQAVFHQGFFKSVGDLLDAVREPDAALQANRIQRVIAQNVGGFVVPSGLMAIDRIFDPTQYSATDMAGMVRAQIPWARRDNQPVINALGEPVKTGIFSGDFSSAKPDPLWTAIAAKQAWVPALPSTVIVGDKKDGPGNFRALTKDEIYRYAKMSGMAIRQELLDNLGDLQTMPPEDAKAYVRKVTADARKDARESFAP